MAEQLQAAQIKQTDTAAQFAQNDTRRGHWLGFVVAIAALIAAIVSLLLGNPWVAGLCLSVPVMAVAKALIDSVNAAGADRAQPPGQ
jgi:cadmium resistance protein CadD (predicted permease)